MWLYVCVFVCLSVCSNNSLFAVPANQEFVYITQGEGSEEGRNDPLDFYLDQLSRSCSTTADSGTDSRWSPEKSKSLNVNSVYPNLQYQARTIFNNICVVL